MKARMAIEDELRTKPKNPGGALETSAVLDEEAQLLIECEAGRRLARLGGTMPEAELPPRRR